MIDERAVEIWNDELEELFLRTGHRFKRVEPRRRMRDYIRGLLGPVGRKNGWQLAEYAENRTPDRLQRLLNGARWNVDELRDDLQHYVTERLGEPDGILILDDTGFLKKGTTSAGVQRRYSGTAGRTENCQIGVFAAYATTRGRALVDRELYLPKSWTTDRDRCRAAHIPDERTFATKPDLARAMVLRVIASPLPIAWMTADSAYGQHAALAPHAGKRPPSATSWPSRSPSRCRTSDASITSSPRHRARHGRDVRAVTARRARASISGPPCRSRPSRTSTATCPPTSGGHWHAAASIKPDEIAYYLAGGSGTPRRRRQKAF
ncbi:IS701 family transposase [Streptomyces rhizosphaerihabitans]|uniref:IS701 family transposase n=1 Tax=Streptomyces rhizosphaerihabitans TaxID=1266770 RepID=UPI0021C19A44|nr:IS701 family transposase [Streptomyces rhizosphaerihabitans]MCT9007118.1 IS701 family transposase [Streptomyces rhizosphaerihabitans]